MEIKKNITKFLEKVGVIEKGNSFVEGFNSSSDPFAIWRSSSKTVSPEKAMGVYSGWVYACTRAIAEELANMQLRLLQIKKDGTHEEIFEHELLDLLHGVNQYQTGYELKYLTGSHLESVGNAYWLLDGVKNQTGKPTAIYILNPQNLKIIKGTLPELIKHYEYREGTKTTSFQPYQILHLKYPDPSDPYEGIGTVQAIAQWIDAENYAMEFNRRFFLNGARIGGFLESENAMTPEQLDFLRKSFESIYKGVENAYKVAALPKGTSFKEAMQTSKDMDFVEGQKMMRDKILAGFRVPKTAIGITEDVNRANAEATNYVFALRTIKPKMQLIVGYLNEFLVPRYGADLYLDFANPVPEDRELKIREMAAAVGGQPVISVNEAREEYFGLDGVKNGDAVMTNFSQVPLGTPEAQKSNRQATKFIKSRFSRNAEKRKSISEDIAKETIVALKDFEIKSKEVKEKAVKDITKLSDDEYEVIWKGFVTRVTPYENLQKEAMQKINKEITKEVIANLEKEFKAVKGLNRKELFKKEKIVKLISTYSYPIFHELYFKEGKVAGELVGVELTDIVTPEVRKAIDKTIKLMADSYTDTSLNLLGEKLAKGINEGASLAELIGLVKDIQAFSDDVRAQTVARTEIFRVANDATREAWKQSAVVKTIKYYTASDEKVCEFCAPMNGKVVGIEEGFFKKGDTISGSEGGTLPVDYADIDNPPIHVNCRCYIRPEDISID